MDAFSIVPGRRARGHEVQQFIAKQLGCTAVLGFDRLWSCGGVPGGKHVAAFMETSDDREWHLPLTADGPLVWQTEPVPEAPLDKIAFVLGVGFGNGSPLVQPTGRWDIFVNDRYALSVRVVKHSQLWRGDECAFAFSAHRIESAPHHGSLHLSSVLKEEAFAAFGPAMLTVPREWVEPGKPAVIRVEPWCRGRSTRWFLLTPVPNVFRDADIHRLIEVASGQRPTSSGHPVYFGDIHAHSGQVCERPSGGCGTGTRQENYDYASGPAGIDFYCLSDHECQVDPDRIEEFFALAEQFERPGRFVCLRGFEFTSLVYGHRNIYFRGAGGTIVNACRNWHAMTIDPEDATAPQELWDALEACGEPFLSVPHHPPAASHPFNWETFNPKHERLVEVYSVWGSSEYYGDVPRGVSDWYPSLYVRAALGRGLRFGLIASSDGHDGQPGNAQRRPLEACGRHGGSGWAAVLCDELTRENVFDALNARRCYATSGVPIALSFEINGAVMGSELPALGPDQRPVLRIACQGSNGIDHLRIVKNGQVVHTRPCHGERQTELEWADDDYRPGAASSYYLRVVQVDHESAWSSPIWIG